MLDPPVIKPLGESAVVVEFGNLFSEELNQQAIALAETLNSHPFPGLVEAFPSYSSTTVFYDLVKVRNSAPCDLTVLEAVKSEIIATVSRLRSMVQPGALVEIPVDFSAECGLDLETVAVSCQLNVERVIDIFVSRTYRVYMIGFVPGFAYMGQVDKRIHQPRKQQPRVRVPKGSVGIAGPQTGVYPFETPGGWQILGRTETEFFRPDAYSPSLLKPGDQVRFVPL